MSRRRWTITEKRHLWTVYGGLCANTSGWLGFPCLVAGKCLDLQDIEWDHRTELAAGGEDRIENLQPLCRTCHMRKTRAFLFQRRRVRDPDVPMRDGPVRASAHWVRCLRPFQSAIRIPENSAEISVYEAFVRWCRSKGEIPPTKGTWRRHWRSGAVEIHMYGEPMDVE